MAAWASGKCNILGLKSDYFLLRRTEQKSALISGMHHIDAEVNDIMMRVMLIYVNENQIIRTQGFR
jgi:hypothetical protein